MQALTLTVFLACDEARPSTPVDAGGSAAGPSIITYVNQAMDGSSTNAELLAFQDGDGPWQIAAGMDGVYRLVVTGARYGVVTACENADATFTRVAVDYFAVTDGATRYRLDVCHPATLATVPLRGTIRHAPPDVDLQISDGISTADVDGGSFTLQAVPGAGARTLMGVIRLTGQAPTGLLLEHVDFASGAVIDLDIAEAFAPAQGDLDVDLGGATGTIESRYVDADGRQYPIEQTDETASRYLAIPADRLGGGMSLVHAQVEDRDTVRDVARVFTNSDVQTLRLPERLSPEPPPAIVSTNSPQQIVEARLPRRAEASFYAVAYSTFDSGPGGPLHTWQLFYSATWAAEDQGDDLVSRMPDFTVLAGWKANYGLEIAAQQTWSVAVGTGPTHLLPGASRNAYPGVALPDFQSGDETSSSAVFGDLR